VSSYSKVLQDVNKIYAQNIIMLTYTTLMLL